MARTWAQKVWFLRMPATAAALTACTLAVPASAAASPAAPHDSPPGLAAATVKVGADPVAVAADQYGGKVWVANAGSDSVTEISTSTLQVLATVPLGASPSSLAILGGYVWVGSQDSDTVAKISEATAQVTATITVGDLADAPLIVTPSGNDYLEVASSSTGNIWAISVTQGTVSAPYDAGGTPAGMIEFPGEVWLSDPSTSSVRIVSSHPASIPVGTDPQELTYDPVAESVWVANEGDGTISEIGRFSETVTATLSAGVQSGGQFAMAADPSTANEVDPRKGYIWIANTAADTLDAVSETTGQTAWTIPVGSQPDALAVSYPGIWVANKADGTVTDVSVPEVTMPSVAASYNVGQQVSFQVTATGYPAVTLSVQSLPPGLTMAPSGLVSGTLTEGGIYALSVNATNALDTTQGTVYLTVNQPPVSGPTYADQFTAGQPGPGQILGYIYGYPVPTATVSGRVPAGLTPSCGGYLGYGPDFITCDITGTPAAGTGGLYTLTLTGSNGLGSPVSESTTVAVDQAPAITSPGRVTFRPGRRASFTIRASGYPVPRLKVTGRLPNGLKLKIGSGTAVISGKIARSARRHVYRLTITAGSAAFPAVSKVLTITIS